MESTHLLNSVAQENILVCILYMIISLCGDREKSDFCERLQVWEQKGRMAF